MKKRIWYVQEEVNDAEFSDSEIYVRRNRNLSLPSDTKESNEDIRVILS